MPRLGDRLEAPVRQDLTLVRLDEQHTLLAAADAVELGMCPQIEVCVIEAVVELAHPVYKTSAERRRSASRRRSIAHVQSGTVAGPAIFSLAVDRW
jgi:hypothetical protein